MGIFAPAAPDAMLRPLAITLQEAQSRSDVRVVIGAVVDERTPLYPNWFTSRSKPSAPPRC
jgi:hypothetical protein